MLFPLSDLYVIQPLHCDHQSTLIFKHMRNHTHVNACVQVSYLPCVYIALASRTDFKLERERRAWSLPRIPTSTQDKENINASQVLPWKHKMHPPDVLGQRLPPEPCSRTPLLQTSCIYRTEELTFENQKSTLCIQSASCTWRGHDTVLHTVLHDTVLLFQVITDMCQQPNVNSFFFLLIFGSMSVYLTGIAYKMVQTPKETC